jgi:acetyl-CoA carboxylase carboxyl transferase subunit alpha
MVRLKVPIIIVGEGASGGALGIEWRPRFHVGKHLVFGNFPESCSSFYGKVEYKEQAAEALKLTSSDMKNRND